MWVYIAATGGGSDHADGLQCYAPDSTGKVTVKNSTFLRDLRLNQRAKI
jgi:hypothetical protein